MQVEPQNTIPLIYQITDPSDSTIYYIRAIVYDSLTRDAISTHNLVSRGDGLWSSTATAPADGSGLGKHIHVIIRVYTDSGYTTLSDIYNQQIDKYLVKSFTRFGGGGVGQDVDYEKIRKIVDSIVSEKIGNIKSEPINLSEIKTKLNLLGDAISNIKMPNESKPLDVSPIIKNIKDIEETIIKKIEGIKIEKPQDYSLTLKELGNRIDISTDTVKSLIDSVGTTNDYINSSVRDIVETLDKVAKEKGGDGNKIRIELAGASPEGRNREINKYF